MRVSPGKGARSGGGVMDTHNSNFPWPSRAQLAREADREAREADAITFNATLVPLATQWAELREKLAAIVEKIGKPRSKGWALACLEDMDASCAMLLDEAKERP